MTDQPDVPPQPKPSSLLRLAAFVAALTLAATALGFFGGRWWALDLFSHFRLQYAAVLALCLLAALAGRHWILAALCLAGVAANGMLIAPLYVEPAAAEVDPDPAPLTILAFNVLRNNVNYEQVKDHLRQTRPHLALFQEVNNRWIHELNRELDGYLMVVGRGRDDSFGIVLFARDDVEEAPELDPERLAVELRLMGEGDEAVEAIEVRMDWEGRPLAIWGMHAMPPLGREKAMMRDAQLAAAAEWSSARQAEGDAVIVLGDLNTTPFSHAFAALEREGRLVNSQLGYGWQATWPSQFLPLMIPIDHCLHSADLVATAREIGESGFGSDHRPLLVRLQWAVKESERSQVGAAK